MCDVGTNLESWNSEATDLDKIRALTFTTHEFSAASGLAGDMIEGCRCAIA